MSADSRAFSAQVPDVARPPVRRQNVWVHRLSIGVLFRASCPLAFLGFLLFSFSQRKQQNPTFCRWPSLVNNNMAPVSVWLSPSTSAISFPKNLLFLLFFKRRWVSSGNVCVCVLCCVRAWRSCCYPCVASSQWTPSLFLLSSSDRWLGDLTPQALKLRTTKPPTRPN